jgi:hypothetical protein
MSSNNKKFILNQILWLGISLGISLAISMILPFPTSLVAIIGVFILLNIFMRRIMMKRTGVGGGSGRGLFGYGAGGGAGVNDSSLKYYCMNCGTQHSKAACPKCGSKMKRVGS